MDNQNLENRITVLEKWKSDRIRQQITYPVDVNSLKILNKSFLSLIGTITNTSVSGQEFSNILVSQNEKVYAISVFSLLISYTASSITDRLTLGANISTGGQGTLPEDAFVVIYAPAPGNVPSPLDNGTGYFVVNSTGTTIQISNTMGGSPINLTDNGVGPQYIGSN